MGALLPILGMAQGIVFEPEGDFGAAIRKAKAENKVMFVDFYTDWCGPCKQMTADVFTRKAVGDVFNRNFVNVKVNAEKGEGVSLAEKAGIMAYPTMLFLDPHTGKTLHAVLGYRTEKELLADAQQIEESGKYGGLAQMRTDFEEGRSDIEFLVDFFRLLPDDDETGQRSAIAERYLLNVPKETFKSEDTSDIVFIGGSNGIMGALRTWNDDVMYRMLDFLNEKYRESETGFFSSDYNIGIVFIVELTANRFLNRAIERGDEELMEKVLAFQKEFRKEVGARRIDGDTNIMSGRGIFFASPEMVRLKYMVENRNDPDRFRTEVVPYMDNLMAEMPVDSLHSKKGGYYMSHLIMKEMVARNVPQYNVNNISMAVGRSDMAVDYIIEFANYYWRLMPNDKKTKQTVAKWLNYACQINPYYKKGAMDAAPLLVKIGQTNDALANLQSVLDYYGNAGLDSPRYVGGVRELIGDIRNDKI